MDAGLGECGCGDASVYYLGKRKTRALSRITIHLIFHSGLASQRRGEELPRTSLSQTQATHHIYLCRERSTAWYAIFQLQFPSLLIDLAYGAANSLVFAEYTLASFGSTPSPSRPIFSPVRLLAFVCLTGVLLLHGLHIPAGIRLQNVLGFMKIGILLIVIGTGFIALTGNLQEGVPRPGNFDSWEQIWAGSTTGGSALCTCLRPIQRTFIFL